MCVCVEGRRARRTCFVMCSSFYDGIVWNMSFFLLFFIKLLPFIMGLESCLR